MMLLRNRWSLPSRLATSAARSILLCSLLVLSACLDKIELDIPKEDQDALVIDGVLRQGNPSQVMVRIGRIFNFTAAGRQDVNVRTVFLLDDADNSVELEGFASGHYALSIPKDHPTMKIEVGRTYRLRISTFDGQELVSIAEPLLEVPDAGQVDVRSFKKDVVDNLGKFRQADFFEFSISSPTGLTADGKNARLRYVLEQTYKVTDTPNKTFDDSSKVCYITNMIAADRVNVIDGNELTGGASVPIPLHETAMYNSLYAEGYVLTVYQQSLSESAFTYWQQVSQVLERTGNMFEAPAGKIRSNFATLEGSSANKEVFGYFYVTQQDTSRFYISPDMAGNPATICPWLNAVAAPGRCPKEPCCDCLTANGSQSEVPDFWVK